MKLRPYYTCSEKRFSFAASLPVKLGFGVLKVISTPVIPREASCCEHDVKTHTDMFFVLKDGTDWEIFTNRVHRNVSGEGKKSNNHRRSYCLDKVKGIIDMHESYPIAIYIPKSFTILDNHFDSNGEIIRYESKAATGETSHNIFYTFTDFFKQYKNYNKARFSFGDQNGCTLHFAYNEAPDEVLLRDMKKFMKEHEFLADEYREAWIACGSSLEEKGFSPSEIQLLLKQICFQDRSQVTREYLLPKLKKFEIRDDYTLRKVYKILSDVKINDEQDMFGTKNQNPNVLETARQSLQKFAFEEEQITSMLSEVAKLSKRESWKALKDCGLTNRKIFQLSAYLQEDRRFAKDIRKFLEKDLQLCNENVDKLMAAPWPLQDCRFIWDIQTAIWTNRARKKSVLLRAASQISQDYQNRFPEFLSEYHGEQILQGLAKNVEEFERKKLAKKSRCF